MADKYKLTGSKHKGERMDRLILTGDGTKENPDVRLDRGGAAVELSEDQVTRAREIGAAIRKVESGDTDDIEADNGDAEDKQEQQAAQAGPGTTAGASTTGTRPAAGKPASKS